VIPVFVHPAVAQHADSLPSGIITTDTLLIRRDSLLVKDSVKKPHKESSLKAKVEYSAKDSIRFEIGNQKVFLYQDADIKYQEFGLKANYVEIDFVKHLLYATGTPDSTGKLTGIPVSTVGNEKFKSKIITYNYTTKRGYIQSVLTKEDEGYLHGQVVKKMENDITYIHDGSYTTCDIEQDPHYEFRFGKAKVIPGKKVVTGPAYMVISNVPVPLGIPFGFFPSKSGRRSGIVVPTYGESANRGFFLENGGYYWAASKYLDVYLLGDIYSRGSWAIKPTINYKYRYHYYGTFNFSYAVNLLGASDSPDFQKETDFQIRWTHQQDGKARPHSSFSANVNIVSNTFNRYNLSSNAQSYLSNTFQSSINYSTNWNNTFYLTMNFNHSQNTLNKTIDLVLPQINFSVTQLKPFQNSNRVGKKRWYENITFRYSLDAKNVYNTYDTLLFKPGWQDEMKNGILHTIPISLTTPVFKYLFWTNTINLNDRMYLKTIRKEYIPSSKEGVDSLVTETRQGFANEIDGNFSTGLSTYIYGMYQFKKGPVVAIRHMMTPTVSFSYTPDFGAASLGYWRPIGNDTNTTHPGRYSIFEQGIYGGPPGQKSGLVGLALANNLEMKVKSKKDTVTGTKKIMLIENLTFRTSYDLAKDSVRWAPIGISGYTTLFKYLKVTYGSSWDMYARDSLGRRTNSTEWEKHHRLLRLDITTWNLGLNFSISSEKVKKKKTTTKGTPQERQDIEDFRDYYVDFDIPWSISVAYNFAYTKQWPYATSPVRVGKTVQTLGFTGQLNITPKWKISVTSGWDFISGSLSYTSIDVYRDLHCWEMRFGWVPKGYQQSWNFSINVKASILQDLKLNKKKDFRDYID
jgi:lipopolysaccharide assembly outer membrane protein LptD (OstA)